MAIKAIVTADEFEQLPEALREHYDVDGDNYVLVTDKGDRDKLNEFRDNNRALFRENSELKKKAEEIETALKEKPQLMICGASAYSRDFEYSPRSK